MSSILVTRPRPAADVFAEKLRGEGFHVYVAPMLEYAAIPVSFGDLSSYQALLFTSAEAVRIFAAGTEERTHPVLAVGDATGETAFAAGFKKVYSAKGGSLDVAGLIGDMSAKLALKKILYLCAEDTAGDVSADASKSGVEIVSRPVYKASFVESVPEDVRLALRRGDINVVPLFSARTADNFVRLMRQNGLDDSFLRAEAVCISGRVADIVRAMPWKAVHVSSRPDMESMMEVLKRRERRPLPPDERRQNRDRRQREPLRDAHGHVQSPAYSGPDRRFGDRRAHAERQQKIIMREKMKFVNRTVITFVCIFMAVVLAAVFLLAPEYARIREAAVWISGLKKDIGAVKLDFNFSGTLNSGIEKAQKTTAPWRAAAGEFSFSAAKTAGSDAVEAIRQGNLGGFLQVLDNVPLLRRTPEGDAAVARSMETLRGLLAESADNPDALGAALEKARLGDSTLDSLFNKVGGKDTAAVALLLVLNEFRSNVSLNRPYADDLALLQQFAGNDPEMNKALERLAPYAAKGIMSREALQGEFKNLAADIVMAKLAGEDISVKEQAVRRFNKLTMARQPGDVEGEDDSAVAARAQLLLEKGNVKGAVHELQALDGASAKAAEMWIENAAGHVMADQSSDDLMQGILESISGGAESSIERLFSAIKESVGGADVSYISPVLKGNGGNYDGVLAPSQ